MTDHSLAPWCAMLIVATLVSCTRYEYVKPDCGSPAYDPPHSQIAWLHTGPAGRIAGRVIQLPDGKPLASAQVSLQNGRAHFADAGGQVVLDSVGPGHDTLLIRAFGYARAIGILDVQASSGIVFIATMEPRAPEVTDGCGFLLIQRRKPWWKVW